MKLPVPTMLLLVNAPAAHAQEQAGWTLPQDPDAIVLSLDFQGGYGPRRRNPAPYLEVRADGGLRAPDRTGGKQDLHGKLSPKELQELLEFVVDEERIFDFDSGRVLAAMREAKGDAFPVIMDAADTVVTVRLEGRRKVVRLNALEYYARVCPKVAELQRFEAVRRRLGAILCVVQLGGDAKAAALLVRVNASLAAKWPDQEPLGTGDLSSVRLARDGSRTAWLQRRGPKEILSAEARVSPEGEIEVELRREPVEE